MERVKKKRSGIATHELWISALLMGATYFFPDLPTEALSAVAIWVAGRGAEKIWSKGGDDKRAIFTTEFWLALATGGLYAVFPSMPIEALGLLGTYVAGRVGQKIKHQ